MSAAKQPRDRVAELSGVGVERAWQWIVADQLTEADYHPQYNTVALVSMAPAAQIFNSTSDS
jgi:hypothetical protein